MRVLVACEMSGVVRDAFAKRGHDVMSCDFLPTLSPGLHYQGDVFDVIDDGWDLMIAHPPCTYLCSSGLHWNKRNGEKGVERSLKTEIALDFVRSLMNADIDKICIENPVGCISTRIRKPDCSIQPYEHGEDASKKTHLWLKNLAVITPTNFIKGRDVESNGKRVFRWGNQTNSGQNNLPPSKNRGVLRSITYKGIAEAFADQWGGESK